ncbi:MAG TPA: glycosyltransferase family 39 protein [Verrucomicrobiae bacterium]|jgi:4-amino-4-deoxy-L-arabinose transferase-like glycosyltransferase
MRPTTENKLPFSLAAFVLILAFAVITFYHLGVRPLQDYDEAIYAQVAHEAMQSRHQLGFTWLGNPPMHRPILWFEKPPLMIWLTEAAYAVFGVNEFAARFWTAIFAVLTLPLTFLFAQKLSKSYGAALLSVASFFAAFQFCEDARILQMDIPVGFFVLLSLYAFWCARENKRFYFLFWTALACGLMVKSVIGLLPLPIVFVFSVLARDFDYLKIKQFWMGVALFLVLILPWHIIESVQYGKEFWHQYLFYHLLERYSTAIEGNSGPVAFYLGYFWQEQIFFWCLVMALIYFVIKSIPLQNRVAQVSQPAVSPTSKSAGREKSGKPADLEIRDTADLEVCGTTGAFRKDPKSSKSKAHLLFVTTAFFFIFLFFSTAGTKLPPYILVIYPYAAIAIGMTLADLSKWLEKFQKSFGSLVMAVAIVIFLTFGFQNVRTNLAQENDPQLVSDKAVGEYLKGNCLDEPVYFYTVQRPKPSIIFYSDRTVGYFADFQKSPPPKPFYLIARETPNVFPDKIIVFSAETEKIYQIR